MLFPAISAPATDGSAGLFPALSYDSYFLTGGLFTSIAKYNLSSETFSGSFTSGTYTFSMVASDGTVGSVTFSVPVDGISSVDKTISPYTPVLFPFCFYPR